MDHSEVIDTLTGLIKTCRDGEQGFRACTEIVQSRELHVRFTHRAEQYAAWMKELESHAKEMRAGATETVSSATPFHQAWPGLSAAAIDHDEKSVLEECAREEAAAISQYRNALQRSLPAAVQSVIEFQLTELMRSHQEICSLRDRYPARPSRED